MRNALAGVVRTRTSLKATPDILQQWAEFIMKPAKIAFSVPLGPILIIIDALDEGGDPDTRKHLLQIRAEKVDDRENRITNLPDNSRFLVTSQPLRSSTNDNIQRYISNELRDVKSTPRLGDEDFNAALCANLADCLSGRIWLVLTSRT